MQTFDDVLSQLVALLRRSEAGGFIPHPASAARTASAAKTASAASLVSYRGVYRCPSSSWGEGAYVPEASAPAPTSTATPSSGPPSGATSGTAGTTAGPSVRMPFRLFEDG